MLEFIGCCVLHKTNASRGNAFFSFRTFEWMSIKFGVRACVRACARARARAGRGRESCTVVSSSAQPPPYIDLERNSIDMRSGFSKATYIHTGCPYGVQPNETVVRSVGQDILK